MGNLRRVLIAFAIITCLTWSVAMSQDDTVPLTVEDKIYGLSLVWQEANYNFAFFDRKPDVDWDSLYRDALHRVMQTKFDLEYFREMQRFVALYGEGHTNSGFPRSYRDSVGARPALELEEIERRAVVVNASRTLIDTIPIGSVITHVDGVPVDSYLKENVFPYMSASTEHYLWRQCIRGQPWRYVGLLYGKIGSTVSLTLEKPNGDTIVVSVERLSADAEIDWDHPTRPNQPILTFQWLDHDIAYFALNTFNDPEVVTEFETHLSDLAKAKAVILDIRNNGGGNSAYGWNIGRYFSDVPLEGSHWRTRKHIAAYKAWGRFSDDAELKEYGQMNAWEIPDEFSHRDPPESGAFVVPLAILTGSSTYSAAEDFLSFMRAVPHCVYIGGTSAGSTGQPLTFETPGGAWVGITSKRDVMPDGTEFVGIGIPPDIEVHQTVAAFQTGRDLVLERTVEELSKRME